MKKWLTIIALGILIQSCRDSTLDEGVLCTEEFRIISVKITGGQFDEFYTVRKANNDTIRLNPFNGGSFEDFYPVLDDSYHSKLKNDQDTFTFHGFLESQLLIKEDYIIKADQCHIELVNGKTEIQL